MPTVKLVAESEAHGKVKEIYDEIKKYFDIPFVPNIFRAMAGNPDHLEATWQRLGVAMKPGKLDLKTKEIVALVTSAVNGCETCTSAHTAILKSMGFGDAELLEIMAVVDHTSGMNKFASGLMIPPDL